MKVQFILIPKFYHLRAVEASALWSTLEFIVSAFRVQTPTVGPSLASAAG